MIHEYAHLRVIWCVGRDIDGGKKALLLQLNCMVSAKLVLECQWDEYGVTDGGHSGVAGDFYRWRWSTNTPNNGMYCGDGYNQTLPDSLQRVVCQQGIRLSDFLYSIFWPDGSWDLARQANLAMHNDQSLDLCPNNTGTTATSTTVGQATIHPTSQTSIVKADTTTVAVVGATLGGALAFVLLGAIVIYIMKRPRVERPRSKMDVTENKPADNSTARVTPFLGQSPPQLLDARPFPVSD
ncbi:uncharacterized protein B0H18DRAFT_950885 [Fomitopsis serialis]|uniref:uncharacterized protein n=1 Tax=Fomitopsis serialis TaxID=139415 RepID=UPI0020086EF0|nr:uncharacterized protein B0H18DRAFT_950885 [Neoantrodia serialis]KAH9935278.1 hypothetical protein B0H18DRAFT_950885 [Neoantrodia serialis]